MVHADTVEPPTGAREITENHDTMNVPLGQVIANMTENCTRKIPWFVPSPENKKTLVIVGGSPSLKDNLGLLKKHIKLGAHVCSLNGSLKYLQSIGVRPNYHAQFDARPECRDFLTDAPKDVKYLIGSMSDPSVFDNLDYHNVMLWHGGFDMDAMQGVLKPYQHKPIVIVGGGSTIGLRAMFLGYFMGYRKIIVFGMDSSFSGTDHHAYRQDLNNKDQAMNVWVLKKQYQCSPWMYRQGLNFKDAYAQLSDNGCSIKVIGKGLIPDMCSYYNSLKSATISQEKEKQCHL